jgi:hypothetical protein
MRTLRVTLVVLALIATTSHAAVAQRLQPLVVDWGQYFRVESESSVKNGRPLVSGRVWNTANWGAKRIQLLIDGVDAGGQVVDQRVIWLGVDLAPGTHAAFEVSMPASPGYRVSVFAFDSGRGGRWS